MLHMLKESSIIAVMCYSTYLKTYNLQHENYIGGDTLSGNIVECIVYLVDIELPHHHYGNIHSSE